MEKNLPYYEVSFCFRPHARGGSPTCFDRVLASRMGVYAVEKLISGNSNAMVGVIDENDVNTSKNAIKK